jgi:hypothetical protein
MKNPASITILAGLLRRRFSGHSETVRSIVAQLSDVELVESYQVFNAGAVAHARHRAQKQPLEKLFKKAVHAQS